MMKNILKLISLPVFVLTLLVGIIACESNQSSTLDENTVRAYADPATETTLQGLSENNLAKYTQYGNAVFKAALTQEALDTASAQINSQFGAYKSKEFLSVEEQEGYIVVHYKVKYEKGEVGVRMVFDNDHLVAGQWFE
jgi:hypothetical protein